MKQKLLGTVLYVFDTVPYQITEDTSAKIIKVQQEVVAGFKELNESLADKIVPYNYHVICTQTPEWAPYVDEPDPEPPVTNYHTVTLTGTGLSDETVTIKNNSETVALAESYQVVEGAWFEIFPLEDPTNYTLVSDNMSFENDPANYHWYVAPNEDMNIELNYSAPQNNEEQPE